MHKCILYLVICFSITSLFISHTPISKRKFIWQIHSFNDRRELTQILRKGSTLLKIDLFYSPQNKCYTNDPRVYTDPRGCFLITHDKPVQTVRYDSIYDYFDEIVLHKTLFSNPNLHFDLALCFKNTPRRICEDKTQQFISLVDDIYIMSEALINKYKLNLKVLHDTAKPPFPCMFPKWPNWGYTWIRTREPDDAFYSNNTELYYDKYIVFNNKDILLEPDAKLNYGKFKDMSRAVQIWEPIHQEDVLYYAKIFQTYPHKVGYAYAINSDTSMYQVYSAPVSNENLNYNLYTNKDSSTKTTVFKVINEKYLYVFRSVEKQIDFYEFVSHRNSILHISSLYNVEMPSNILKDILYMNKDTTKNKKHFMIMNIEGEYCLYEIENYKLNTFNCGKFIDYIKQNISNELSAFDSVIKSASITLVNSHVYDDNKNDILLVYTTSQNQLNTAVFEYNTFPNNLTLTFISSYQNLIHLHSHVEHLDMKCTSKYCLLLLKEYSQLNVISHLFNYYPRNTMLKFYASPYKNFGVGYFFSLALSEVDNVKDKFILLKDNAFCYHSEEQNKSPHVKVCDQVEQMQPHILNYIYGDIDMESIYNEDNYSSVCNHHIMTGTYDMGDYPRVDLFRKSNGMFEFVEMHDGINSDMKEFVINCGLSRFYDGIVVDNWDVGDVDVGREKEIK